MKRNTLQVLITELRKYGTLSFNSSNEEYNCEYTVNPEHEDSADFMAVRQKQENIHEFCVIAALCFDLGFSPVFDVYLKHF